MPPPGIREKRRIVPPDAGHWREDWCCSLDEDDDRSVAGLLRGLSPLTDSVPSGRARAPHQPLRGWGREHSQ